MDHLSSFLTGVVQRHLLEHGYPTLARAIEKVDIEASVDQETQLALNIRMTAYGRERSKALPNMAAVLAFQAAMAHAAETIMFPVGGHLDSWLDHTSATEQFTVFDPASMN